MTDITVEKFKEFADVGKAIEFAQKSIPHAPERPAKPFIRTNHTQEDLLVYNKLFAEYTESLAQYNTAMAEWKEMKAKVRAVIEEFIKQEAGLYHIPAQYQKNVWERANNDSDGYWELYLSLDSLTDIFETH